MTLKAKRPASTILLLSLLLSPFLANAETSPWAATVYAARISTQPGWADIIIDPLHTGFADSGLVTVAVARQYAIRKEGALTIEAEGQVVHHIGEQTHWEFNAIPVSLRWHRFPWSERVATTAAFGLGLSYATELPSVELELEGESHQLLVYWMMEMNAGPVDSQWAISLRLHHRSVAYGLMGANGGMNAVGLGMRYQLR